MKSKIVIYALLVVFFCFSLAYGEGIRETPSKHSLKLGPNDDVEFKNLTLSEKVAAVWAEINNASFSGNVDIDGELRVDTIIATTSIEAPSITAEDLVSGYRGSFIASGGIGYPAIYGYNNTNANVANWENAGTGKLLYGAITNVANSEPCFCLVNYGMGAILSLMHEGSGPYAWGINVEISSATHDSSMYRGTTAGSGNLIETMSATASFIVDNDANITASGVAAVAAADFRDSLSLGTMALATATDYLENDGGNAAATVAFNNVTFATGTAAAPGLCPDGDTDTGFYSDAVNTLSLSVGGYQTEKQKRGYRYQLPDSDDVTRQISYDMANAVYRMNYSAYRGTLRFGGGSSEFAPARTLEFYTDASDVAGAGTLRMTIKSNGIINMSAIPAYADNAAAKTGGLVDGDLYHTAGALKITYTP